jgi:hypothetical protein
MLSVNMQEKAQGLGVSKLHGAAAKSPRLVRGNRACCFAASHPLLMVDGRLFFDAKYCMIPVSVQCQLAGL